MTQAGKLPTRDFPIAYSRRRCASWGSWSFNTDGVGRGGNSYGRSVDFSEDIT